MLYKRGNLWWLKFSHGGSSVYIATGLRDHAKARAKARELRYDYEKKHGQGGRTVGVPVAALEQLDVERAASEGLGERREETLANVWRHVRRTLGDKRDVSTMLVTDMDEYEGARRKEGAKGQTIRRETQALVRGLRLAKRAGLLPALPFDPDDMRVIRTDPKDERMSGKDWTTAEIHAVLGAFNAKAVAARYPEILRVIMGTGLRLEEARRLSPSWLRGDVLRVPGIGAKSRKPREVPVNKALARSVRDFFPVSPNWKPNRGLAAACRDIDLDRVLTPRDLRTWYLNTVATKDVLAAQRLAGHSSVKTTGIYVRSDRDRALAAGAKVLRLVTMPRDRRRPASGK